MKKNYIAPSVELSTYASENMIATSIIIGTNPGTTQLTHQYEWTEDWTEDEE